MSDIRIKDIGKDISLTLIEIVTRDQTPDNTSEPNVNIIVNSTSNCWYTLGFSYKKRRWSCVLL